MNMKRQSICPGTSKPELAALKVAAMNARSMSVIPNVSLSISFDLSQKFVTLRTPMFGYSSPEIRSMKMSLGLS